MTRTTIFGAAAGVVLLIVIAAGAFYLTRGSAPTAGGTVPPLPADARLFDRWALVGCQSGATPGNCSLILRVVNRETERLALQMTVSRNPAGNPVMLIRLPPNVVIPTGVTLTPMGGTAARGAVRICRPQFCAAGILLSDMLVMEMSAAETTNLQFVAANGRNVSLNLPTRGFGQGFAAWQVAYPAPAPQAAGAAAQPAAAAGRAGAAPAAGAAARSGAAPAPAAAAPQPGR